MADQALSAVANSVIHDWNNNTIYDLIDVIINSSTAIPGDVVTRDSETSTTKDVSEHSVSASDPDSLDVPYGVLIENVDQDLDTAYSDNDQARVITLGSGAIVWLQYAADDQSSAVAVYPGDKIVASETEAGKVMKAKELSATTINTPTTALLRDAVVDQKIAEKGFIGICQMYSAGSASDDKWIRVKLV